MHGESDLVRSRQKTRGTQFTRLSCLSSASQSLVICCRRGSSRACNKQLECGRRRAKVSKMRYNPQEDAMLWDVEVCGLWHYWVRRYRRSCRFDHGQYVSRSSTRARQESTRSSYGRAEHRQRLQQQ